MRYRSGRGSKHDGTKIAAAYSVSRIIADVNAKGISVINKFIAYVVHDFDSARALSMHIGKANVNRKGQGEGKCCKRRIDCRHDAKNFGLA